MERTNQSRDDRDVMMLCAKSSVSTKNPGNRIVCDLFRSVPTLTRHDLGYDLSLKRNAPITMISRYDTIDDDNLIVGSSEVPQHVGR